MSESTKPLPVADTRSAGFWEATARHRLAFQRCIYCKHFAHPPVIVCPSCNNTDPRFDFESVSGRGELRTWTVMRDAFLPSFRPDIPWVVGEAEMDEAGGVRLVARVTDVPDSRLRAGAPVWVDFQDVAGGITLPVFRLGSL